MCLRRSREHRGSKDSSNRGLTVGDQGRWILIGLSSAKFILGGWSLGHASEFPTERSANAQVILACSEGRLAVEVLIQMKTPP